MRRRLAWMAAALVTAAAGGSAEPARGPLRVHPDNPRYFTDGTRTPRGSLRAVYPIFMDPYDGSVLGTPGDRSWEPIRRALGDARRFADRLDLAGMKPANEAASTGYSTGRKTVIAERVASGAPRKLEAPLAGAALLHLER